jgi:hypothetical protein
VCEVNECLTVSFKLFFVKIWFWFCFKLFFSIFGSLWCSDIKNKILKIKKYYLYIFLSKKYFEKQLLTYSETPSMTHSKLGISIKACTRVSTKHVFNVNPRYHTDFTKNSIGKHTLHMIKLITKDKKTGTIRQHKSLSMSSSPSSPSSPVNS